MAEPLTLGQALQTLQRKGIDRLEAQLLLSHVLGRSPSDRSWLVAHDSDNLSTQLWNALEALAQRRLAHEPMAYLTGSQAFYDLNLQVSPAVLVPRPDTETLVDWALDVLPASGARVLDLGTGSGAIALAIKSQRPGLEVVATDRSRSALEVARSNASRLRLNVSWYEGDWFDALPRGEKTFDCIVANPPYIASGDTHLLGLQSEPQEALVSGSDGLLDLHQIVTSARKYLKAGGWLLLEHGHDQALSVRALLDDAGFVDVLSRQDLGTIERCSGGQSPLEESHP